MPDPSRPVLLSPSSSSFQDKENAHHHGENTETPYRKSNKTPLRCASSHHEHNSSFRTTPPGSSKVLRKHFEQLAVTPHRKLRTGAIRLEQHSSRHSHLQTGAVRVAVPTTRTPRRKRQVVKSPPRVGIDGTHRTPSKELLRSTACSRSHQIHPPTNHHHDVNSSNHEDLHSLPSPILRATKRTSAYDHAREEECCDPVALTLWNDGREDLDFLIQHDTSSLNTSFPDRSSSIPKVSSSLLDVVDDATTLVRPVPKVARP